eukprot:m.103453 g.103453  ORF g.103453 m.103453 type:complete len:593 (+) comp27500_c0_seq1:48-1826(+)
MLQLFLLMIGAFANVDTATTTSNTDTTTTDTPHVALKGLWPMPRSVTASGALPFQLAQGDSFQFVAASGTWAAKSELLGRAFSRYHAHIFAPKRPHRQMDSVSQSIETPSRLLANVTVAVTSADETLQLGVNESYSLIISQHGAFIASDTVYGALHGLETFSQLVFRVDGGARLIINATSVEINDHPRFAWRGLMIDTARHFHDLTSIRTMLDGLAFNRLNVLHWHLTDEQSFPIKTIAFPKLVEGAYGGAGSTLHYTGDDIKEIVAYAKDRGIRVVPEIDSPGHTTSWQIGYPEIAVASMINPISETTFAILDALIGELSSYFSDDFFHIGCDEVDFTSLNASASVVEYMAQHDIPRTDRGFKSVIAKYIGRLTTIVHNHNRTPIAWQEAMDHYGDSDDNPTPPAAALPNNLVIEQWLNPVWNWANLSAITGDSYATTNDTWPRGHKGFRALTTNGWYLDATDDFDWSDRYTQEPLTNQTCTYSTATPEGNCSCSCPENPFRDGKCHCFDLRYDDDKIKLVLGGEACLWGEHIDASNVQTRAFPRASAVAERLWSDMEVNNATLATSRLTIHRCRMLERGVDVTPLGPGFC